MSTSVNAAAAPAAAARERRTSGLLLGLCGVVIALGVWTLLSRWLATGGGVINRLPPPWRVASEIVAYARGDLDTLRPLLSPKLFSEFEQGVAQRRAIGHTTEITVHRILRACVIEAHLGGTMAYVTVDYAVEQTSVTRDAKGAPVEGSPDTAATVEDIWTFTRDIRSPDPNWMLIETRTATSPAVS